MEASIITILLIKPTEESYVKTLVPVIQIDTLLAANKLSALEVSFVLRGLAFAVDPKYVS